MKLSLMAIIPFLLLLGKPAGAGSVIHAELDFDIDRNEISEWEIGPVFSFDDDKTELELPIGQSDGEWEISPEITRQLCGEDVCSLEVGIGAEISASDGEIQPFGRMELELEVEF